MVTEKQTSCHVKSIDLVLRPPYNPAPCPGGGIGRRSGFKIRRWQQHGSSILPRGTNRIKALQSSSTTCEAFLFPHLRYFSAHLYGRADQPLLSSGFLLPEIHL